MRILQVVTLVDERRSYGGPLTVAVGHCEELRRRGHQPTLLAGWQGHGSPPHEVEGVPAHLFPVRALVPGRRYATLWSADLSRWLNAHAAEFDVAHVHLARDLVPLTATSILRRRRVPYVVQTHGMIRPDLRRSAQIIDAALTRPALRDARSVFSLTPHEDRDLQAVLGKGASPIRLPNGVRADIQTTRLTPNSPPDGANSPTAVDVLFLARLHPRKNVLTFARAAETLLRDGLNASFSVVGPDDGDLSALRSFIATRPTLAGRLRYEGALTHASALERLRSADLYVLPSVDEPYPMSILEALAAGVPVVCTQTCGLATSIAESASGLVVDDSVDKLAEALRVLVARRDYRSQLAANAQAAALDLFTMDRVVDQLELTYQSALTPKAASTRKSLLWVTNLATPYRAPLWRELAKETDLTVALLAETEPNRHWSLDLTQDDFALEQLHARVLHSSDSLTLYAPSRRLQHLVSRRPSTLIVDGWESPAFQAATLWAKVLRIPVVASYRSTERTHRYPRGFLAHVRRQFFRLVDSVVTAGPDSRAAVLAMGVMPDRVSVGFNTVDVNVFSRASPEPRLPTSRSSGHHFLYVGQLIDRKNVDGLIRAFAAARNPQDALLIVGTGPNMEILIGLTHSLDLNDKVRFAGHLDGTELVDAYAASDTLVLPSTQEVWGLVVNEALVAGLHVVVTDSCGVAPSVQGMPAVWICSPTQKGLAEAMGQSRSAWKGPILNHPIREHTPRALAKIILTAADQASSKRESVIKKIRDRRTFSTGAACIERLFSLMCNHSKSENVG